MTTLLVILFAVLYAVLVLIVAMHPERTRHSVFELKRLGDEETLRRERLLETVFATQRFVVVLLASLLAMVSVVAWQGWGVVVILLTVLCAVPLSRLGILRKNADRLYRTAEPRLLKSIERYSVIKWLVLDKHHVVHDHKLESQEQLLHLIATSGQVLDNNQRTIISNGVHWHKIPISEVMTARSEIVSIKHTELLGPLVLDDLHKSGHNRFPVMKGSLDTIVGILDITELLEINAGKSSSTAEKSMSPQALRIEADESLPAALTMLQKSRQHMLIVIDEDGKTVGIVTLVDIARSLLS